MKKLILILFFMGGILAGVKFTQLIIQPFFQNNFPSNAQNIDSFKEVSLPVRVEIPKINVNAPVEYVGLDQDGNMDVPKDVNNLAWYQLGTPPGLIGNAVMAGHYDSTTGPAIFFNLADLKPGDSIIVTNDKNIKQIFTVEKKEVYEELDFPVEEVFGESDKARLNLITCQGKFDRVLRKYPERIVIYSTLGKCISKIFNYCIKL